VLFGRKDVSKLGERRLSKRTVSRIMLTLLLMGMLTLAFNIQPVKTVPTTIVVPDDYPTIQEAINNANEGDTIYVKNGTYYENVVVNKTVSLVGENRTTTTIRGYGNNTIVHIAASDVNLREFSIHNGSLGVRVYNSLDVIVRDNVVAFNDEVGILIESSSGIEISGNILESNGDYGVNVQASSSSILSDNNVTDNGLGIYLYYSTENTVMNNKLNNVDDIQLWRSHDNNMSHNDMTGAWNGFELFSSTRNMITYNSIVGRERYGFFMFNSNSNIITGNNIIRNSWGGMRLWRSYYNLIYHNNLINNSLPQASFTLQGPINSWDDGYPSGGSYWSDYNGTDMFSGPNQDLPESDGIGDTPYIIDEYNQDNYPTMVPYRGNVTVINVTTSKCGCPGVGNGDPYPVLCQGYTAKVYVTVENQGNLIDSFDVIVYANDSIIQTYTVADLAPSDQQTLTIVWNATGWMKGNYAIKAIADQVMFVDGWIVIVHPGDLDNSGEVDIADVVMVTAIYRAKIGDPDYNACRDVVEDGEIDISDVVAVTAHYREKDP
jgi:nitrous oxidase accessory protein